MLAAPVRRLKVKRFLYVLIAISITAGVGYGSYFVGLNVGLQQSYFCGSIHTNNYITSLRLLRENKLPEAISMLETSVGVGVVLITPEQAILANRTKMAVQDTLGEVKSYRIQYPWAGNGPWLTSRVENALKNVEAKPQKVCP